MLVTNSEVHAVTGRVCFDELLHDLDGQVTYHRMLVPPVGLLQCGEFLPCELEVLVAVSHADRLLR